MTAALKFLTGMAELLFASQMQRTAIKINARQHIFHGRAG